MRQRARLAALIIGVLIIGFLVGALIFHRPEPTVIRAPAGYTQEVETLNGIPTR